MLSRSRCLLSSLHIRSIFTRKSSTIGFYRLFNRSSAFVLTKTFPQRSTNNFSLLRRNHSNFTSCIHFTNRREMVLDASSDATPGKFERLPPVAKPINYTLTLKPDLKNFTFDGEEIVQLEVSIDFSWGPFPGSDLLSFGRKFGVELLRLCWVFLLGPYFHWTDFDCMV